MWEIFPQISVILKLLQKLNFILIEILTFSNKIKLSGN